MSSPEWMTPPGGRACPRCGHAVGASYWAQDGEPVHVRCMDWSQQSRPPYHFRLPEVRRRWQALRAELALVERAGRLLQRAAERWPDGAFDHAQRIVAAFQRLDLEWPPGSTGGRGRVGGPGAADEEAEREKARRLWYENVGPKDH